MLDGAVPALVADSSDCVVVAATLDVALVLEEESLALLMVVFLCRVVPVAADALPTAALPVVVAFVAAVVELPAADVTDAAEVGLLLLPAPPPTTAPPFFEDEASDEEAFLLDVAEAAELVTEPDDPPTEVIIPV